MTGDLIWSSLADGIRDVVLAAVVLAAYLAGRWLVRRSVVVWNGPHNMDHLVSLVVRVGTVFVTIVAAAVVVSWFGGTSNANGPCISGGTDDTGSYCDEYDPSLADTPEQQLSKGISLFVVLTSAASVGAVAAYRGAGKCEFCGHAGTPTGLAPGERTIDRCPDGFVEGIPRSGQAEA